AGRSRFTLGRKAEDVAAYQSDISDEQPDTTAYSVLQGFRNRIDDHLSEFRNSDDDVDDTADEYDGQCLLPRDPHPEAYHVGEHGIEPHSGCLCIRYVCHESHDERRDGGSQDSCHKHGAPVHACLTQYTRVDKDDV